jgi:hypothetical protein
MFRMGKSIADILSRYGNARIANAIQQGTNIDLRSLLLDFMNGALSAGEGIGVPEKNTYAGVVFLYNFLNSERPESQGGADFLEAYKAAAMDFGVDVLNPKSELDPENFLPGDLLLVNILLHALQGYAAHYKEDTADCLDDLVGDALDYDKWSNAATGTTKNNLELFYQSVASSSPDAENSVFCKLLRTRIDNLDKYPGISDVDDIPDVDNLDRCIGASDSVVNEYLEEGGTCGAGSDDSDSEEDEECDGDEEDADGENQVTIKEAGSVLRDWVLASAAHNGKSLEDYLREDVVGAVRGYGKYAGKAESDAEEELETVGKLVLDGAPADFWGAWESALKEEC